MRSERKPVEICGIPGLKGETWGTRHLWECRRLKGSGGR